MIGVVIAGSNRGDTMWRFPRVARKEASKWRNQVWGVHAMQQYRYVFAFERGLSKERLPIEAIDGERTEPPSLRHEAYSAYDGVGGKILRQAQPDCHLYLI